jgi:hypothetical protein
LIPIIKPKITEGTPEQQISEIKSYLWQLSEILEFNFTETAEATLDRDGVLHIK